MGTLHEHRDGKEVLPEPGKLHGDEPGRTSPLLQDYDLGDRIQQLEAKIAGLEQLRLDRESELKRLEDEVQALTDETLLLEKTEALLMAVSSRVLGQSTTSIDKLVTAGLKIVFFDQNLEFKTHVDKYRGKTSIRFELYQDGKTAPLMNSYGGGPVVTIGILLRVVTILLLNQRRVLLIDESLSHVSEEYHESASTLLKKLCKELGFTILMVTHQASFASQADVHYEAHATKTGTEFKRVK